MRPLVVILTIAAILRTVCVFAFTDAIEIEGSEYGRIASNLMEGAGYEGLLDGPELMLPPLYSFAIAGLSTVTGLDVSLSARLVSLLASLVAIWAVAAIGRDVFSRRAGWIAGAWIALSPAGILAGSAAFSEMLQTALLAVALRATLHALRGRTIAAAAAGLTFGLAYLARVETLPLAVAAILLAGAHRWRTEGAGKGAATGLLMGAALLAGMLPYALYVREHTGEVSVAGKAARVFLTIERFASGMSLPEANYAIDGDGAPQGPWLSPNEPYEGPSAATILARSPGPILLHVLDQGATCGLRLLTGKGVSSVLVLFLAWLAWRLRTGNETESAFLAILAATAAAAFAMAIVYKPLIRYTVPLSIPLYLAAARGLELWLPRLAGRHWESILVAGVVLSLCTGFVTGFGEFQEGYQPSEGLRAAAAELRGARDGGAARVMAADSRIPFLAGSPWMWVPLPKAPSAEALAAYAKSRGVEWIALGGRDAEERLAPWLSIEGPPGNWTLVARTANPAIWIYRLR